MGYAIYRGVTGLQQEQSKLDRARPRRAWQESGLTWLVLGSGLACFVWLLLRTAWVSDDAFISLRTVSNLLHGYGLRWNVDERVQTYTHPLWLFLLTGAHALTREPFFSTLYLSCLVSTGAIAVLLFACPGDLFDKLLALVLLALSQAFIDFCSSGLENPLTHGFVVAFAATYVRQPHPQRRALWLSFIAGAAAFNRLDTLVLFVPAILHTLWTQRREVGLQYYLVGALPILCWEAFSLLYYGFPFPNTAYAKLAQDLGPNALMHQYLKGVRYIQISLVHDPITVSAIGAVLLASLSRRYRRSRWLALGAAAYLVYVVRIGGDFMRGRFLSAPLLMCVAALQIAGTPRKRAARSLLLVGAGALGLLGQHPPPLTGADYELKPGEADVDEFGIHNERQLFFTISSLWDAELMNPLRPDHPWSARGFRLRAQAARLNQRRVEVIDAIGYAGYFAGPRVHIIDHWALADALIARLPPVFGQYGHYPRVLPDGYVASLQTQTNLLTDAGLRRYYSELKNVIQGPLLSSSRLRSIWKLNTGQLDSELDRYAFVRGPRVMVNLRVGNPTRYPCVVTYVWNADRSTAYTLDESSHPGAVYDLTWQISAHAAALSRPLNAPLSAEFQELSADGMFTISIAFTDRVGGPIRELHELRYTYYRRGDQLVVQRQPWPAWNERFPAGPWREGRTASVFKEVDMQAQ